MTDNIYDEDATFDPEHKLDPTMKNPSARKDYDYQEEISQLKSTINAVIKSNNNLVRENNILRRKITSLESSHRSIKNSINDLSSKQYRSSMMLREVDIVLDKLDKNGIIPK